MQSFNGGMNSSIPSAFVIVSSAARNRPLAATPPPTAKRTRDDVVAFLPRRRAGALLSLAAALALIAFLGGYLAGHHEGFNSVYKVRMHATAAAPGASALIDVGQLDKAGNWPLLVHVRHLKPLAPGGYYEMYVTRGGKRIGTCGTFRISGSSAEVRLNAPYKLGHGVGWVVVSRAAGAPASVEPAVLTT